VTNKRKKSDQVHALSKKKIDASRSTASSLLESQPFSQILDLIASMLQRCEMYDRFLRSKAEALEAVLDSLQTSEGVPPSSPSSQSSSSSSSTSTPQPETKKKKKRLGSVLRLESEGMKEDVTTDKRRKDCCIRVKSIDRCNR